MELVQLISELFTIYHTSQRQYLHHWLRLQQEITTHKGRKVEVQSPE
jgi:hypothetical protein